MRSIAPQTPVFSVVIPLFNKGSYIQRAVRSVLGQTLAPAEILVVDDGSTDDGVNQVLALEDVRVRVIRQTNQGVAATRNRGIAEARGELLCFLDADDELAPDHLASLSTLALRFPDAHMYCGGYSRMDENHECVHILLPAHEGGDMFIVSDFFSAWSRGSFTCTNSIAIRLRTLRERGLYFPVGERLGEDQDLWFRLAEAGDVAYIRRSLSTYYISIPDSATKSAMLPVVLPCIERLQNRLSHGKVPARLSRGARRLVSTHLINVAQAHLTLGNSRAARTLLQSPYAKHNLAYYLRTLGRALFSN